MKRVTLMLTGETWVARFHDAPAIRQAFGTDLVPTAYTRAADPDWVLAEVRRRLPGYRVTLERPP